MKMEELLAKQNKKVKQKRERPWLQVHESEVDKVVVEDNKRHQADTEPTHKQHQADTEYGPIFSRKPPHEALSLSWVRTNPAFTVPYREIVMFRPHSSGPPRHVDHRSAASPRARPTD